MSTQLTCQSPDQDGDGYTIAQGDCQDQNACAHPGAWSGGGTYCDVGACDGDDDDCNGVSDAIQCSGSPVLIDLGRDGFHLTDGSNPVMFDLDGDGATEPWSWTRPSSNDAWLALDRDGNGAIDSGLELFGNWTDQAPSSEPNGFLALAEFDKRENGGNSDGWIDVRDAVFADLRLWVDLNRNGVSETAELQPLGASGVHRLSLHYRESRRVDEYGNRFRYSAPVLGTGVSRLAVDVFLVYGH